MFCYLPVRKHEVLQEHVYRRVLVFQYEHCFDYQLFKFRMHRTNKFFVHLYYADIVDGHYIVNVDSMIYVVVHDNPWCYWFLPNNTNLFLDYFH